MSCLDILDLSPTKAEDLIARIDNIHLFSHTYAFHLNFRIGSFTLDDRLIPSRGVSDMPLPSGNDKDARLTREVQDAQDQVGYYKRTFSEMGLLA